MVRGRDQAEGRKPPYVDSGGGRCACVALVPFSHAGFLLSSVGREGKGSLPESRPRGIFMGAEALEVGHTTRVEAA